MKKPATTRPALRGHRPASSCPLRGALGLALAAALAACGGSTPARPPAEGPLTNAESLLGSAAKRDAGAAPAAATKPAGPLLLGVDWIFTWLDGYDGPLPGPAPVAGFTITIEGRRMTGSTSCNSMLSGYDLDEAAGTLRFTGLVNGQILCQRAFADTEEAVLAAMLSTDAFALDGDTLELRGKGRPLARLSPRSSLAAAAATGAGGMAPKAE